jgi:hypothetical protein
MNKEKLKFIIKLILRYGLLAFGIVLTIGYYSNLGVSAAVNTWAIISIIVGLYIAYRNPAFGFGKGAGSLNGIGTSLYGKRDIEPDGSYVATKWFIFLLLPIIPISSYRILPNAPKMNFLTQVTNYSKFEKVPFNIRQVINTYLLIYGFIFIIFVLPFILL